MRPLCGVLLLLLICQLVTSTPIFDKDEASFSRPRRAAFGETIRDWFKILKDRIVGKWHEWFGDDSPIPTFSPQDILSIDKSLEGRVQGFPGLFLDLSRISFDPKRDWGVRFGNWYIIRKVAGDNFNPDSDSDEWDIKPLLSKLPLPPVLKNDWMPNIPCGPNNIPEATRPPTSTPRIESTTSRRETPRVVTQTEPSVLTSTETTVTITEPTVLLPTSTEATTTSTEQIPVSDESAVTNGEPNAVSTESISTESIDDMTSAESTTSNAESTETSNEINKRVEDNETVDRPNVNPTKRPPNSAEVVMF